MTISSTTSSVILNADGSTHNFSFNFKILSATDLKVIVRSTTGVETEKTLNSQYIIPSSSIGQDSGGNVLFKYNTGTSGDAHYSATDYRPANGEKVILRRQPVQEQQLNLVNNDPFNAELIEESLDKLTMQVQALQEEVDRTFRLSRTNILDKDGAQINNAFFQLSDDVATRKGKYLQFNSTTGVIEPSATSGDVTTLAAVTTDIALLADIQDGTSATNTLTVVSGISGNVTTCASISSDITSVAGISSNVTTVAGKASLITSDFATDMALIDSTFVTKMNLVTSSFVTDISAVTSDFISDMSLVTADFISDLNTLASSSIVDDLNILATSDIVDDMALLATSSNVTAMANLGVSSVITNMANLNASGVITNIGTVAGSISNVNTVAAADSNISALNASGVIANIATVAGANSNISTVATNISGVNSFAERYRIASSAPSSSLDAGDLYFDTSTNKLNVYDGSNWASTAEAAQRTVTTHNVTSAGTQTISVSYTVGLVDVYLNGLKLNISEGDATASNGTSVVVTGASVGDIIEVVALSAFNSANYGTAASKNTGTTNDTVPVFTSNGLDIAARDLITTGKILYANMYSAESDLPNASTYHGMFAHVHGTGKGYYSHGGNWIALANESALSSYLTTSTASSTYAPLAGATFTGEVTVNGGINEDHNNGALSNSNQTLTLDCHNGNNFSVTTAANITSFVVSNLPASGTAFFFTLKVTYGGSHSITWGSSVKWNAATAPTLSTSGTDIFAFYTIDSGTTIYGFTAGQGLA